MASSSQLVIRSLIDAYDFGRFGTIVDVGGGNGTLLAALLDEYPHSQACSSTSRTSSRASISESAARIVGGSFFESVPEGGDAYLLKWIIHDWEDEESVAILRNVRRNGGPLLLVERVVEPPNEGPETKLGDLNMLVGPGGQERTLEEFRAVFEAAGYELVSDTPTASGMHVIEGKPRLEERLAAELDGGHAHQRGADQDQQAAKRRFSGSAATIPLTSSSVLLTSAPAASAVAAASWSACEWSEPLTAVSVNSSTLARTCRILVLDLFRRLPEGQRQADQHAGEQEHDPDDEAGPGDDFGAAAHRLRSCACSGRASM